MFRDSVSRVFRIIYIEEQRNTAPVKVERGNVTELHSQIGRNSNNGSSLQKDYVVLQKEANMYMYCDDYGKRNRLIKDYERTMPF